jgi:nucleotide-binding universal stress UspA family protein
MSKHGGQVRLLIGIDGSPEAEVVLGEVCRRSWPAGTEARVLSVQEKLVAVDSERVAIGERIYEKINEDEYFRMRHVAKDAVEKLHFAGLVASPVVQEGEPEEALVRQARDWNADTIFVGARGLGRVKGLMLGSVSSATVAHGPCTVEVVRRHRAR